MIILSEQLQKAINYSALSHEGQRRKDKNKTPYVTHPYSVMLLADRYLNVDIVKKENILISCLLHDVIEDCEISYDDLVKEFNVEIADTVENVSEPKFFGSQDNVLSWKERKDAYLAKLTVGNDEAVFVAVCDKIHNMTSYISMTKEEGDVKYKFGSDGSGQKIWYVESVLSIAKARLEANASNLSEVITKELIEVFEDKIEEYKICLNLNS